MQHAVDPEMAQDSCMIRIPWRWVVGQIGNLMVHQGRSECHPSKRSETCSTSVQTCVGHAALQRRKPVVEGAYLDDMRAQLEANTSLPQLRCHEVAAGKLEAAHVWNIEDHNVCAGRHCKQPLLPSQHSKVEAASTMTRQPEDVMESIGKKIAEEPGCRYMTFIPPSEKLARSKGHAGSCQERGRLCAQYHASTQLAVNACPRTI